MFQAYEMKTVLDFYKEYHGILTSFGKSDGNKQFHIPISSYLVFLPYVIPIQSLDVNEQPHELRDGKCGVRIVQLKLHLIWQACHVCALHLSRAQFGLFVTSGRHAS